MSAAVTEHLTQAGRALADATALGEAGYELTPVTIVRRADGKKGATFHADGGWRHESAWSSDPEQLRAWWVDHPSCSFAVRTGPAGRVDVIDLDVKAEVDAVQWWTQQGYPLTSMVVNTPSGGLHLYARADDLPTSAGVFAPGVDTRGAGGLVFAPGAYVVGEPGHYEVQGPLVPAAQLAPLPRDLADAIRSATPTGREYRADGEIVLKDQAIIVEKCRQQVLALEAMPPRTGGSLFRDAQMGAAMMLGRLVEAGAADRAWAVERLEQATIAVWGSVSAADADNIASGLADGPRKERWRFRVPAADAGTSPLASGPVEAHALVTPPAVLRAVDEGYDPVAAALAAEQAEVDAELRKRRIRRLADEAERPFRPPIAAGLVWDDELTRINPPDMAVGELVPEHAVGFVGGPSGSYKSFLLVQLAIGLAYGGPVMGHPEFDVPRRRRVLYVAGEGAAGVALRTRAARHHARVGAGRELAVYPRAVDLTSEREFDELRQVMRAHGVEHLVVDTFRQSTIGLNENDNTEVGVVLSRLLLLRDEDGVSSTMADHTNKSVQGLADLGGAGAKRANVDYVLMVDLPNGSRDVDQQRTLRVAKLKDGQDGRSWPIRLEPVPAIVDARGQSSAVVVVGEVERDASADIHGIDDWRDVEVPASVREYDGVGRQDLSRVAQLVAFYGSGASGISRSEVVTYFRADTPGVSPGNARKRVGRAWDALHALGLLAPVGASGGSPSGAHRWVSRP